jgi:hypothetical protein
MSEYINDGLSRLESRRIAAGLYRIEGHTVRRYQSGWWYVYFDVNELGIKFRTLRACKEHIYEKVFNSV